MQTLIESDSLAQKMSVVLIDKYAAVRQLVALLLLQNDLFNVVGEAGTEIEALNIFRYIVPDLVILDLHLPETAGLSVLRFLRSTHPRVRVLLFTAVENPIILATALQENPRGYVSKQGSVNELRLAIETVSRGGIYWTPQAEEVVEQMSEKGILGQQRLSERELILLAMVAHGWSSKEIALELEISSKTVDNQRLQLMRKLSIKNATGLTRYALQHGVIAHLRRPPESVRPETRD